jgi:O-methyltransferase/aklanonic acid methyltransferase
VAEDVVARGFSSIVEHYVDTTPQARRLLALAELRTGEHVLDVGCGPGTTTFLAADAVGESGHVVGVDLADEMLAQAQAELGARTNVEIRRMDAVALEFRDERFDAVVANSVLQFTGPRSLTEWRRVTKPGGRVVCSLPWGPVLWYELCRKYVSYAGEPYRGFAARRLAAAVARPDPEAARDRLGFASVRSDVEDIVQTFATPADAWASMYTHGAKLFVDALPDDARHDLRLDFTEQLAGSSVIELRSEFHYWCLEKPRREREARRPARSRPASP